MNSPVHVCKLVILIGLILPLAGHAAFVQPISTPLENGDVKLVALGGSRG